MNLNTHFLAGVCALMFVAPSNAVADVTVLWDSNVEADLAGYQIGYGFAPGQYTATVEVGNTTSYRFTNLEAARTYYFAVRAYNMDGLTSPFSDEVSATTPAPPPLELTNVVVNYQSPMPVGTRIVFGAAPSGGVPPYQYKWFITLGSTQTVAQAWSADSTLVWTPTRQGNYTIKVWVRSATSSANAPDNAASVRSIPFEVVHKRRAWEKPTN